MGNRGGKRGKGAPSTTSQPAKLDRRAKAEPVRKSVAQELVRFSFEYADTGYDGPWGFHTDDASSHRVMGLLCQHGRRRWAEVWDDRTGGQQRHRKHHDQEVGSLCAEAQARLGQLKLDEVFDDRIFRFRDGNLGRLWGFVADGLFHVVWWDPDHLVYPTEAD